MASSHASRSAVASDIDVVAHGTAVADVARDLPEANSGLDQTPDAVAIAAGNGASWQAPDQQSVELQTRSNVHNARESAPSVAAWEEHPNRQQDLLWDR